MGEIKKVGFLALLIVSSCFYLISCDSDDSGNNTNYVQFYLTDCPYDAEAINIEILQVSVSDEEDQVKPLETNSGVYNLLDFTDGLDTLIAYGDVVMQSIDHIYFDLGDDNTIVVDGKTHPLQLRGKDNRVKVKASIDDLSEGNYLVDFFACTSIVRNANGYFLKPVIKFKGPHRHDNHDDDKDDHDFDDKWNKLLECYSVSYPVSFIGENNEELTANNQEEMVAIFQNNDVKSIQFPFTLEDKQGEQITISSYEDLKNLEHCKDFDDDFEDLLACYSLKYPIVLIDKNGEQYEAKNQDELMGIIENYDIVSVTLPITLIDSDGKEIEVQSLNDLKELEEACED